MSWNSNNRIKKLHFFQLPYRPTYQLIIQTKTLKKAKNQGQALVMTEVVKGTAVRGRESVEKMKDQSPSKKVLASLGDVENTFRELGEVSYSIQKEMIEAALQDLGNRVLSEEDQTRLEKAKEYFKEGKESEAIILIGKIGYRK